METHVYMGTLLVKADWMFGYTRKDVDEVIVHFFCYMTDNSKSIEI